MSGNNYSMREYIENRSYSQSVILFIDLDVSTRHSASRHFKASSGLTPEHRESFHVNLILVNNHVFFS